MVGAWIGLICLKVRRDKQCTAVNMVMNLQVPKNLGDYFTS
jgi:hypothetical protein